MTETKNDTWQRTCLYCDRRLEVPSASRTCTSATCKEREIVELRERLDGRAPVSNSVLAWGSDLWVRESALEAMRAELERVKAERDEAQDSDAEIQNQRNAAEARVAELERELLAVPVQSIRDILRDPLRCTPTPPNPEWLRALAAAQRRARAREEGSGGE